MAKDKGVENNNKKLFVGVICNCAAELKLLLSALLLIFDIATFLQLLPHLLLSPSPPPSDLRLCLTSSLSTTNTTTSPPPLPLQTPTAPVLENGIVNTSFRPYGTAAYNFILMGAYRGGLNTFAVIGLSSKPLHSFASPTYQCQYMSSKTNSTVVTVSGTKMLTDWGYGRAYTAVVVNCTFADNVGVDGFGGVLVLEASTGGGNDRDMNVTDRIHVLEKGAGTMDVKVFSSQPKYDYLYSGSSLYGVLSPQRMREWIAYHVRFFGVKSHFVIHDAGGIHPDVLEVLKPCMELG